MIYNSTGMSVVVGTNLSGKESHREVGVDSLIALGSLGSVMVSTLIP